MFKKIREQRLFAVSFMVLYLCQNEIIYPFEASIRTDDFASMASLVYLPHGLKVFCALVLGMWSLPLIFVAQTLNTLYFVGSFSVTMLASSLLAMVSMAVPIALFNRTLKQPIANAPFEANTIEISSVWLFIVFAILTSMLNSSLQTLVHGLPNTALLWYFLFGDIMGSIAFFVIASALSLLINRFLNNKKGTFKL